VWCNRAGGELRSDAALGLTWTPAIKPDELEADAGITN
jgi:hypothetical protein